MYIIISGNPVDRFIYIGPFDSSDDAIRFVEQSGEFDGDWWVTQLDEPNKEFLASIGIGAP